jgi:hypothetical protein
MRSHSGGRVEGKRKGKRKGGREMSVGLDLRCFLGALPPVDFRAVCYIVSKAVPNVGAIEGWERKEGKVEVDK